MTKLHFHDKKGDYSSFLLIPLKLLFINNKNVLVKNKYC